MYEVDGRLPPRSELQRMVRAQAISVLLELGLIGLGCITCDHSFASHDLAAACHECSCSVFYARILNEFTEDRVKNLERRLHFKA